MQTNLFLTNALDFALLAPFFSALFILLLKVTSKDTPRYVYTIFALGGPAISALSALILAYVSFTYNEVITSNIFTWIDVENFKVNLSLQADTLGSMMLSFVAPIGFLIHIYATGYMKDDSAYARFFALFNIFLFSMILLILADNPIMMFVGWEGVGVTSYALIAFYFESEENMNAGNKAFILNRIGDFGFLSALMLLFVYIGEYGFTFEAIFAHLHLLTHAQINLIAFLLFVGAMGKSAQIPLYVWLPDAMAGPTPVSALIHAATMVTAGVYMVARFAELYNLSDVGLFISYIGAFSALLAALIATRQYDIKKILAYSTMSQLGYMFMAAGIGSYSYALFHVFTHAFFKAMLFMGAGAVIVALHHEQDIRNMRGLKEKIPLVFIMMLIGSLSISAIAPFAGFFSKDAIMAQLFASQNYFIYFIALFTSALTAFYMFRMIFWVFYGKNEKEHHIQVLPSSMIMPMLILTLGTIVAGFFNIPSIFHGGEKFSEWLSLSDIHHHLTHVTEYLLMGINFIIIVGAIAYAYRLYAKESIHEDNSSTLMQLITHKFYVDELYDRIIVKPLYKLSQFFDVKIDKHLIDRAINQMSASYIILSLYVKNIQNAQLQYYLFYIMGGISALLIYLNFILEL